MPNHPKKFTIVPLIQLFSETKPIFMMNQGMGKRRDDCYRKISEEGGERERGGEDMGKKKKKREKKRNILVFFQ
jgi:hypothetical protein